MRIEMSLEKGREASYLQNMGSITAPDPRALHSYLPKKKSPAGRVELVPDYAPSPRTAPW